MSENTHDDISQLFLKWFSSDVKYKNWLIMQNSSGFSSVEKVHYGVPPCGGGADYFAFGPGGITEFFEIKTNADPTLKPKQKIFRDNMTPLGFKCWIVREFDDFFYYIDAKLYRPTAKNIHESAIFPKKCQK